MDSSRTTTPGKAVSYRFPKADQAARGRPAVRAWPYRSLWDVLEELQSKTQASTAFGKGRVHLPDKQQAYRIKQGWPCLFNLEGKARETGKVGLY